ncbi:MULTISPECIES: hypothetical protein [unclassified Nocardiopsis]|uniref:hypothetical protein n=1 Tax=Nocardiopsis TaxID=2013 RepID=UPI00387B89B8
MTVNVFKDPWKIGPYTIQGRYFSVHGTSFGATDRSRRWFTVQRFDTSLPPWYLRSLRENLPAARRISSPRVLPIADMDLDAASPWYAHPYLDAPPIQFSDPGNRLPGTPASEPLRTRLVALGLIEALADIHAAGLAHGDLGPLTVFLGARGPVVADTGVGPGPVRAVRWTHDPRLPEQVGPDEVLHPADDVFAWGVLVTLLHTSRNPYPGEGGEGSVTKVEQGEPVLDGLPEDLVEPVRAALHPDRDRRPTAAALLDRLTGADADPRLDPREVSRAAFAEHWRASRTTFVRWGRRERPLEHRLETYVLILAVPVIAIGALVGWLTG